MKEDIEGFHCHDGGKKGNLRDSTYRGHDFETYILHPSVSLPCAALRFFGKGAVPEASAGVVTDRAVQGDLIQRKTKKDRMYKYSTHSTDLKAAEAAFSEMCLGLTSVWAADRCNSKLVGHILLGMHQAIFGYCTF